MGQKFVLSLKMYLDMEEAAATDDLNKSINYAEVAEFITEFTKENTSRLIETAASDIADALLLKYNTLSCVEIKLSKPWAPIGLPLDGVGVSLTKRRSVAYIGLGSNMGDKKGYLDFAVKRLGEDKKSRVVGVSSYITTAPVGGVVQEDFLNGCVKLETIHSPHSLLRVLNEIEKEAGRIRDVRWGPRTLDLDILLFDDLVMSDEVLTIPHMRLHEREFALAPLAELAPYAYHGVLHEYIAVLLDRVRA